MCLTFQSGEEAAVAEEEGARGGGVGDEVNKVNNKGPHDVGPCMSS